MNRKQRRHAIRNAVGHPNRGLSKTERHLKNHCAAASGVIPGERAERNRIRQVINEKNLKRKENL